MASFSCRAAHTASGRISVLALSLISLLPIKVFVPYAAGNERCLRERPAPRRRRLVPCLPLPRAAAPGEVSPAVWRSIAATAAPAAGFQSSARRPLFRLAYSARRYREPYDGAFRADG